MSTIRASTAGLFCSASAAAECRKESVFTSLTRFDASEFIAPTTGHPVQGSQCSQCSQCSFDGKGRLALDMIAGRANEGLGVHRRVPGQLHCKVVLLERLGGGAKTSSSSSNRSAFNKALQQGVEDLV